MARQGIVAIELELTEGTAYTLWAPSWREGNAEWQALMGEGDDSLGDVDAEEDIPDDFDIDSDLDSIDDEDIFKMP